MRRFVPVVLLLACDPKVSGDPTDSTDARDVTDAASDPVTDAPTDTGAPVEDTGKPVLEVASGACPEALAEAVTTCTVDTMAAFGFADTVDGAIAGCSTLPALRAARPDLCAGGDSWLCLVAWESAWGAVHEACGREALARTGERTCALGRALDDPFNRRLIELGRRTVDADELVDEDPAQLDGLLYELGYDDPAPMLADYGGSIDIIDVVDRFGGGAYTAWRALGAGVVFRAGTAEVASRLWDSRFEDCTEDPGTTGAVCEDAATCAEGRCTGRTGAPGWCVVSTDSARVGIPCDGSPNACVDPLICAGPIPGGNGSCSDPGASGWFGGAPWAVVPADGLDWQIPASGLATVSNQVDLVLDLRVARPEEVVVTLENPATTVGAVPVRPDEDGVIRYRGRVNGFPGDESVTGPWTVHITGGGGGVLAEARLGLVTRWD